MTTAAVPAYTPRVDDHELPGYSRDLAPDEHLLERQIRAQQPFDSGSEYEYSSKTVILNLGRRLWPTKAPSYGLNGVIDGWVEIKRWDQVTSVEVGVQCIVSANVNERGMARFTTSANLLNISRRLYPPVGSPRTPPPDGPARFPFTITLPSTTTLPGRDSSIPLPPSYYDAHPGISGDVKWVCRVDISRRGFRRHECLKAPILYFPKSMPPAPPVTTLADMSEVPLPISWKEVVLEAVHSHRFSLSQSKTLSGKLCLPLPTVYASFHPIHFTLQLPPTFGPTESVLARLSVSLVKSQVIICGDPSLKQRVVGQGEVYSVEERDDGARILKGTVTSEREAGEMAFKVPGYLDVKYVLRIRLAQTSKPVTVPALSHDEPVEMTTHGYSTDAVDTHWPVLGLLITRMGAPMRTAPFTGGRHLI